jgi:chitinase
MWRWLGLVVFVAAGCRTTELNVELTPTNANPHADAGTGSTYLVGSTIVLDGTGSFDPDGEIRSYRWELTTPPAGASVLVDPSASATTYMLTTAGVYVFELTVADNEGATATSAVTFVAAAPGLVVDAGPDQTVPYRQSVQLNGTYSIDPDLPVTIHWTLVSHPAASSAVLSGADTLVPSFFADVYGSYLLQLTVSTQFTSVSAVVTVAAIVPQEMLNYLLVDAEYSATLDRLVTVSDAPPQLHVLDPTTSTDTIVALSVSPNAVAVAPDGLRAAVGHINKVTVVDLQTFAIVGTYAVPLDISDLVFGADGRVHCFGKGFSFFPVYSIDVGTGTIQTSTTVESGYTSARLRPDHLSFYTTTSAESPEPLERWNASASPVSYVRRSSDIQHSIGGNLWFTRDGFSIITTAGNVFYASDNSGIDMTFHLNLAAQIRWADDSIALHMLAAARTVYDNMGNVIDEQLVEYDDQTFAALQTLSIPGMHRGSFVAYRSDASKIYLVSKSATTSTLYSFEP